MIMPISTGGIGNVEISSGVAKAKSKTEEKAMDAFASLMNMTSENYNNIQNETSSDVETSAASGYEESGKKEYEIKDDTYNNIENSKSKKTTADAGDGEVMDTDKVSKALTELKEMVMDKLDITEEELDELLNNMNISLYDLMDVNILRDFILTKEECSNIDILINENISTLVGDMTENLQDIISGNHIENVEEFISFAEENINELYGTTVSAGEYISKETNIDVMAVSEPDAADMQDKDADIIVNIKSEDININTQNTDKDSFSGNQYQQHGKETPENVVTNNLNQAVNNAFMTNEVGEVPAYVNQINEADVVRQIIDEIRVNVTKDTTSMEVQLNPESLGKVQINVASKDGMITAQIITENEAAKHAVENNIALLKETFNNQELKVEAVEVTIASYEFFNQGQDAQFEENRQNNASGATGNINLNNSMQDDELSDEQKLQIEVMKQQGSSVNYSV